MTAPIAGGSGGVGVEENKGEIGIGRAGGTSTAMEGAGSRGSGSLNPRVSLVMTVKDNTEVITPHQQQQRRSMLQFISYCFRRFYCCGGGGDTTLMEPSSYGRAGDSSAYLYRGGSRSSVSRVMDRGSSRSLYSMEMQSGKSERSVISATGDRRRKPTRWVVYRRRFRRQYANWKKSMRKFWKQKWFRWTSFSFKNWISACWGLCCSCCVWAGSRRNNEGKGGVGVGEANDVVVEKSEMRREEREGEGAGDNKRVSLKKVSPPNSNHIAKLNVPHAAKVMKNNRKSVNYTNEVIDIPSMEENAVVEKGGRVSVGDKGAGDREKRMTEWRVALLLESREKVIERQKVKLFYEFDVAKKEFVTDHVLSITILDRVIDSAGTLMVISPYKLHNLSWFLVVLFEMTIYCCAGGFLNYYFTWQSRGLIIAAGCFIFGVVTYSQNPFSEDSDKWIDWCGRGVVILVIFILILCAAINNAIGVTLTQTPSLSFLNRIVNIIQSDFIILVLDGILCLAIYVYVVSICQYIGVFNAINRMLESFKYAMHDHVVDVLVEKSNEKMVGLENLNTGLQLIQQWDDIIRHQRRMLFVPWPDVRPPNLTSTYRKLVEIKWSAFFNLTINNLRTSLGLTLLHPAMCSGIIQFKE